MLDLLLIALLLGAAGIGAYEIGHRVDRLSNQAASQDPELNGTTTLGAATSAARHAHTSSRTHVTPLFVGGVVLAVLLAFVGASLISALLRARKRQRWRVS